jgi:hypothetical protein
LNKRPRSSGNSFFVVIMLLLVILAAAFWPSTGGICCRDIALLTEEKEKLTEEIIMLKNIMADGENDPSRYQTLFLENNRLRDTIPDPQELPVVLSELEELLNSGTVTVHSMQIGSLECEDNYCTVEIDLQLEGNRTALLHLLEKMEAFHHLFVCNKLIWSAGENGRSSLVLAGRLFFASPGAGPNILQEDRPKEDGHNVSGI